jgi:two-component system, NarL family, invasion response regulator UvrY
VKRERARLVIADDHRLMVEGLQQLLGRRFEVVGVAYSGDELLALLGATAADGLILDLSLPGRSGIDLLPDIRRVQPDLRILVVTMHVDRILAEAALAAGALGFVPKDSGMDEVEKGLREVLAGRRYLSPRVPPHTDRVGLDAVHASLSKLTPRQQAILRLLGQGKTSADIGARLGLSENTITFHRQRIRKALGLTSEWALLRHALLVHLATGGDEPPPRARRRR